MLNIIKKNAEYLTSDNSTFLKQQPKLPSIKPKPTKLLE